MKNLFILTLFLPLLLACRSSRSVSNSGAAGPGGSSSPTFLNNVSIRPSHSEPESSNLVNNPYHGETRPNSGSPSGIEGLSSLQFKYAILLNVPVEALANFKLLNFMDEWYGTQYHYGGDSKEGIDCSAFVCLMMRDVYGVENLPRISREQFKQCVRVDPSELREGDLVFFHTLGRHRTITHVGIYLQNQHFIHASTSGVMISSLAEGYYAQHFAGAGRVLGAADAMR